MSHIKTKKDVTAYVVARVSDKEQESNEAQIHRLRRYSQSVGFKEVIEYQIKESSTKADRKKFQEIIAEISKSKNTCALVVDTIDRLQRSYKESVMLDEMRKTGKVELHFYREGLVIHRDSNSAEIIRWDMGVLFAKSYVLQLSDNVKRAFEHKRKDGCWIGTALFGYDNVPRNKEKRTRADLVVNHYEAYYVKEIFERYRTGNYSLNTLCDWLAKEKVKTKKGLPFKSSALHHLLCNPFYHGVMQTQYGNFPHRYEPLIKKSLFLEVQRELDKKNNNPILQKGAMKFAFGNGLLSCKNCGCSISGQTKKGKFTYYHCTDAKKICKRIYVPEAELMKQVVDMLKSLFITDEQISEVCDYLKKHHDSQTLFHRDNISRLQNEYNSCQTRMNQLLELLIDGKVAQDRYDEKVTEYTSRQEEINSELEDLTTDNKNHHITARTILLLAQNAVELFESSDIEEKQAIVKLISYNSLLDGKNLEFTMRKPFDSVLELSKRPVLLRG